MQQIGIVITVHNRNESAKKTIQEIRKHAPIGCKIVVVDVDELLLTVGEKGGGH